MARSHLLALAVMTAGVAALALVPLVADGDARPSPQGKDAAASRFEARLLEIARTYETYGRVDNEYRWAPQLCRAPSPGAARFSASGDAKTHGRKLYSLFADDQTAYLELPKVQPVGQVIVKQSWVPEAIPDGAKLPEVVIRRVPAPPAKEGAKFRPVFGPDAFLPYSYKDGKYYKAARQADLFIMYKLEATTEGSDQGWVYGTVTADGKKVTSAGRVEACMKCHQKAAHDRLFGLAGKGGR